MIKIRPEKVEKKVTVEWMCKICYEVCSQKIDAEECYDRGIIVARYRKGDMIEVRINGVSRDAAITSFDHGDEDNEWPHENECYLLRLNKPVQNGFLAEVHVSQIFGKKDGKKVIDPGEQPRVRSWEEFYTKQREMGY